MTKIDIDEIRKFGRLDLMAKQLVEGFITGLHKSPYHGFSVEFAEHKQYNQGESIKNIDWKLYARTDRFYIKKFEEETNLRAYILLDTSGSMFYPRNNNGKITFAIYAACSLAYLLHRQRDAVGLITFSENMDINLTPKSTSLHFRTICQELEKVFQIKSTLRKSAVSQIIHDVAEKIHKRSLVIIFSDMLDNMSDWENIFSSLQHLKHNHHEVLLFHIKDKATEVNFDFTDKPYRFIDIETGKEIKIKVPEVKDLYVKSMNEYIEAIKSKAGMYKIDYIEADIHQGYEQILLPYLVKRSMMT